MKWPFHDLRPQHLSREAELIEAMTRVLRSERYILGPEVEAFESEFGEFLGGAEVVGLSNATDALELGLRALGVKPGDEVVIPAFTALPTAMAVLAAGATPVLADIEPSTFTLDPAWTRKAIGPATRAIIAVHLYGQSADLTELGEISRTHGIPLLEDAAQAQGARHRDRPVGTIGAAAAFSFYPTKNLGAVGDAGALSSRDAGCVERVRCLRFYGQVAGYDLREPGRNARLDELQAALLRVKLKDLSAGNARRREHAQRYRDEIRCVALKLPVERPGDVHVYHQFVVRCEARDALREHLARHGVETLIHYPRALSQMQVLRQRVRWIGPPREAERAAAEVLSLPIHPDLAPGHQDAVLAALSSYPAST